MARFAREGFQKARVRAIAVDAGVSEALVFHHFGSKGGLRAVCDAYVLDILVHRTQAAASEVVEDRRDLLGVYLSNPDEYMMFVQYMVRAIGDDAPCAAAFVDAITAQTEESFSVGVQNGSMRPSMDPRAMAVLNVWLSLAILTIPPPLARALGYEHFGPEVLQRLTIPVLELYTRGIYTDTTLPQSAAQAWAAARSQQQEQQKGNDRGD